jgi:hypothetical protein
MTTVSVDNFKKAVRIALDENNVTDELTGVQDTDTLTLDELIVSKIEDAAEAVVRSAPIDMISDIGKTLNEGFTVHAPAPLFLKMVLPADFLRLIRFKVSGWDYAVHEVTLPTRDIMMKLNSPYGVYGSVSRPIIVISPTRIDATHSGLMLQAYCVSSGEEGLDNCLYVAKPKIVSNNISLGDRLERPTVYYAASLVASALGNGKAAEELLAVCKEMLNLQ